MESFEYAKKMESCRRSSLATFLLSDEEKNKFAVKMLFVYALFTIFTEESWILEWIQIRVDEQTFNRKESYASKNIRIHVNQA